ncbi:paraquat-inducible protein A [Pectobacterium wasabiae]|uniref:Paraquat-inducible protein A n=1 Tax=Pectobacterium wasabiae TaxID=55208 RepID=A0AAW3EEL3_9GAMM|nr:paraquat-inducible protein A [Pectobacterium wasabiae]AOR65959.1 paraquat-inducible protein A [Pectobacterium wasabiae CFBP 3304]EJS94914.1 Paraquat-inducible protein A [Pectobacterium wasabiae CFBP 3304]KFX04914.1 paraquat-inducible protein A [Pectobacterium wasabiae]KGA27800.1 paraquat-inducible protein A [Pectobacterium wasabiae]
MKSNPPVQPLQLIACPLCGLVCQHEADTHSAARCPRCQSRLTSTNRTNTTLSSALLVTALILYIPANTLPVMYTRLFGLGSESTILSGVIDFWHSGDYGIALLIFTVSIVIPCMKFLILGLLISMSRQKSRKAMAERAALYRLTEWVGYWSMLDVVVIAAVSALVRFPPLSEAEPRSGMLFFGLVVILTMLSAMSYDPRLIWKGEEK